MKNLKPCPFCGGENIAAVKDESGSFYVFCCDCGVSSKLYNTLEKAVNGWKKGITGQWNPARISGIIRN